MAQPHTNLRNHKAPAVASHNIRHNKELNHQPYLYIHNPNRLVVGAANNELERWVECHAADPVLVRREGHQALALQRVPQLHRPVAGARG
jgi:hypothetical protein